MSANDTLASLYFAAAPSKPGSDEPAVGDDGRPLPPVEITQGYLKSPRGYLRGGQESADVLKALAAKHASLEPQDRVLDWGCSSGRVLRHFMAEAEAEKLECWGVDLEAQAIDWAREHLHPILFATCTALPHLPFPDASFKLIYGLSVMTHIEHLEDMWLLELRRLLAPGGLVVLTIQDEDSIEFYRQEGKPAWIPDELDLDELLDGRELRVISGAGAFDTYTLMSKKHIHRVWAKYFRVAEIIPRWVSGSQQSAVVLLRQ